MGTKRSIIQTITDGKGVKHYIPPEEKKTHKYSVPIRLVIPGKLPSKKNRQVADINYSRLNRILHGIKGRPLTDTDIKEILSIKPYIRNAADFLEWEKETREDIVIQCSRWKQSYEKIGLSFPITEATIVIRHCWADRHKRDNSNKAETIHDLLVACGILLDDQYSCLYENKSKAALYNKTITDHLTLITITAHNW